METTQENKPKRRFIREFVRKLFDMDDLTNKKKEREQRDLYDANHRRIEEEVFSAFPKFSNFKYIGITMKVTDHEYYKPVFYGSGITVKGLDSRLTADYVDGKGKLQNVDFRMDEMLNIKDQLL